MEFSGRETTDRADCLLRDNWEIKPIEPILSMKLPWSRVREEVHRSDVCPTQLLHCKQEIADVEEPKDWGWLTGLMDGMEFV